MVHVYTPGEDVTSLFEGLVDESSWRLDARSQVERLARRLLEGHRARHPGAVVLVRNGLAGHGTDDAETVFGYALTEADAWDAVAVTHGFRDGATVRTLDPSPNANPAFEAAVEALLDGDAETLNQHLDADPSLIHARSHYGHRSTLLIYLAANGVEMHRQRVPSNAASLATCLLERGADQHATASVYGGEFDVRALLDSSAHPANAGVADALREALSAAR